MSSLTAIQPQNPQITPKNSIYAHSNNLDDVTKINAIADIAEMLTRGERSTKTIIEYMSTVFPSKSCARETAIKYRNAALALIARESKPMNREHIRQLEVGRYHMMIERIYKQVEAFEDATPPNQRDPKWIDSWQKLLARLNDYGARLHAITGINEITINNNDNQKRILFIRPSTNDTPTPNLK